MPFGAADRTVTLGDSGIDFVSKPLHDSGGRGNGVSHPRADGGEEELSSGLGIRDSELGTRDWLERTRDRTEAIAHLLPSEPEFLRAADCVVEIDAVPVLLFWIAKPCNVPISDRCGHLAVVTAA